MYKNLYSNIVKKLSLINSLFILIGIAIGIILSLQIRAEPIPAGSSPGEQVEIQKDLLTTFTNEQDQLKAELSSVQEKLQIAGEAIIKNSSSKTLKTFARLKSLTAMDSVSGEGIRIILSDKLGAKKSDFSSLNEDFVQVTDVRDIVNALFLKDADAISINGKRITPLTPIQPVFDSVLVGNFQLTSPFTIEAIGNPIELESVLRQNTAARIQIFVDTPVNLSLDPLEAPRSVKFISLYPS